MTLLLLGFSLLTARAEPPPPPPPLPGDVFVADDHDDGEEADDDEMTEGRFAAIASELGLTDAQRTKLSDLVFASRSAKVDIKARAEKAKIELRRLMMSDTLDEKGIGKAVDALNAAESDLRKNKIQLLMSIRKELSEEQWKKLAAMRQDHREDRREMRREFREERREHRE